ncbi:MAG TPA: metallophosphoesterase, partial [Burkholderiales bacterium]|nr:metallophosphoesterase [Burkholderiales bacterium]
IIEAAARFKPDLVIHVGDYLYRESPCPEGNKGCAGSPYGYGFDAWQADFFSPAEKLLAAVPWVFVRGNHEACFRAGKGWFRYLFPGPYRTCADYTQPYSVPISRDTQLIVFDSSAGASDGRYPAEFETVEKLAAAHPHNFFLSHHPILGFSEWHDKLYPGNVALQSAMKNFPEGTDAAFHGHVHLYEALDFESAYPATFVNGNSGTAPDEALPQKLPEGAEPFPGAIVKSLYSTANFGFMTLEKMHDGWLVTERDVYGKSVWSCRLRGRQCL